MFHEAQLSTDATSKGLYDSFEDYPSPNIDQKLHNVSVTVVRSATHGILTLTGAEEPAIDCYKLAEIPAHFLCEFFVETNKS